MVKEFTLNRCPTHQAGQMMTPDRGSCCGVISRRDPRVKNLSLNSGSFRALRGFAALMSGNETRFRFNLIEREKGIA